MTTTIVPALIVKNFHVKKRRWIAELCSAILAPLALSALLLNMTIAPNSGQPPSVSDVFDPKNLDIYFPNDLPYGRLVVVDSTVHSGSTNPTVASIVSSLNLPFGAIVYQPSTISANEYCGQDVNQCVGAIIFIEVPNPITSNATWSYIISVDTYLNAEARKWKESSAPSPYQVEPYLQRAVDSAILNLLEPFNATAAPAMPLQVSVREVESPMPKLPILLSFRNYYSTVLFIMCFAPASQLLLFGTITEKQDRLKESLWMMGVSYAEYTASWYLTALIESAPVWLSVASMTKALILPSTSYAVVILLVILTGLATLSMTFIFEVFFSNARTGPSLGLLLVILVTSGVGAILSALNVQSGPIWVISILFTPGAWWIGIAGLVQAELPSGAISDKTGGVPLPAVCTMLVFQTVAYIFIGWYLSQVVPQPFGSTRSLFFLFDYSYWRPKTQTTPIGSSNNYDGSIVVEPMKDGGDIGISIKNLSKVFVHPHTGTKQTAVANISLDVKVGTVLGLLGRNGAGKTTLISMLTGILPPTSGDAIVNGLSIFSAKTRARGSLGVCPQHDTIFPTMTVRETLALYAKVKNVPVQDIDTEVSEIMQEIGLTEKANYLSGSLSGGQKRRLSVGIAFIGGSRIVILDEMTSGVDPVSRRELWKIVQKYKSRSTILLTTHFLDEAEALSDRIAILGEGELKCVGSSLFLKKEFGVGYTLVVVVPGIATSYSETVGKIVTEFAPDTEIVSIAGGEIHFRLSPTYSAYFGHLIRRLENSKDVVQSFNLSVTTLDEVFLRLSMDFLNQYGKPERLEVSGGALRGASPAVSWLSADNSNAELTDTTAVTQSVAVRPSFAAQTFALMNKVVLTTFREKMVFATRIIFPLFCSGLCAYFLRNDRFYGCSHIQPAPASPSLSYLQGPLLVYPELYSSNINQMVNGFTSVIGLPTAAAENDVITNKTLFLIPPILNITSPSVAQVIVASIGDNQDVICAVSNLATNLYLQHYNPGTFVNLTIHRLVGVPQVDWNFAPIDNLVWVLMFVGYALPGLLASNSVVRERTSNAKFQQFISGVRPLAYWTAQFMVDGCIVLVTSIVSTAIFVVAKTPNYSDNSIWLFLVIFSYGLASMTVGYVVSHFAKFPSSLITMVLTFYASVGFYIYMNAVIVLLIVVNLNVQNPTVSLINLVFGVLNPCAALFYGLFAYSNTVNFRCSSDFSSLLSLGSTVGKSVGIMFAQTLLFFLVAVCMDVYSSGFSAVAETDKESMSFEDSDVDVMKEKADACNERIVKDNGGLVLKQLNKEYGGMVAVQDLSFRVAKGTCFALLGSNGCGKTSTFNMLCGNIAPTSGEAFINGWGLSENMTKVKESLGVCPQFDALQEYLTVREVITFYGQVKGISRSDLPSVVNELLTRLDLMQNAEKLVAHLSGGNKRKTSVAIALIGNPPIILLDEPSTGMDILSKRRMWDVITSLLENHAVVITTHSMEEAEAISNRLAIMSRGQLKCIGSMNHLRTKYSIGVSVDMELANQSVDVKTFGLNIKEMTLGQDLHVSVQIQEGIQMAFLFDKCEDLKRQGLIREYRISPASLEQIFLDVIHEAERDYKPAVDLTGLAGVENWNKKYKGGMAALINVFWFLFAFGWMAILFTG
ncbi:UNVERIFIED_CONTAM: hypothetical protein HDU68_001287, partial [Siphonaria sp. JEL0065]